MPRNQVRVQQRKVKPRVGRLQPPPPPAKRSARVLQARLLEGHSPKTVFRLNGYLAAYQVALLLVAIALAILFREPILKILDVVLFLMAILIPGALFWPGLLLAFRDRKAQPNLVQGQMVGASPVSEVYGLGLLYIRTRQSEAHLKIERRLLKSIPQAQVQVAARVSPNLHHVSSVQVMGQRLGGSVPSEVPEKFRFAERFPLYAMGGSYGGVFGLGILFLVIPLYGALFWLHVILVPVSMAVAALSARFLVQRYQKKLEATLKP